MIQAYRLGGANVVTAAYIDIYDITKSTVTYKPLWVLKSQLTGKEKAFVPVVIQTSFPRAAAFLWTMVKSQAEENFNVSTKDRFQTASLVSATDNPKLFGLRKNVSDFGVTHTNEYITGGEAGHLKTIDDGFEMEGVDPHNIATAEYGKKLLGFIPYGYKGEVKANVGKGAKEAFIPKELMENMVKGVSKDDTQHSFVQDLRNKGFAGGGLVRGNMYNAMRRRMR